MFTVFHSQNTYLYMGTGSLLYEEEAKGPSQDHPLQFLNSERKLCLYSVLISVLNSVLCCKLCCPWVEVLSQGGPQYEPQLWFSIRVL
ncbi:hypothetical protein M1M38_gp073 [Halorubrum tailed virus 27]|uniref:Uncharacterized protein n=1 Tax=Halorubrum tailed virus 27 TaxID=2878008 RepID=A0AAE9BZ64_9CAUD|nr:hypothetical protein M1M38_gp073 [Halorubrum tailed virus 27]UBF22766.1 hypothetical protein HRTV-27_gp73 [Halorubrum tailed virus 27]